MSDETEVVLIFQREHSNRIEEWVAPHSKVEMDLQGEWVYVRQTTDVTGYGVLVALRHIVEAHLITRPKQVDIGD